MEKKPMVDGSELKLHRLRQYLDSEIERYLDVIELGGSLPETTESYLRGLTVGLQKARIQIFTPEESAESEKTRREVFG